LAPAAVTEDDRVGGLGKYVTCHISEFLFFFATFDAMLKQVTNYYDY